MNHKYTWEITDLVFYQAMRDSNVSKVLALTMYYAVLRGGPRWEIAAQNITAENATDLAKKVKDKKQQINKELRGASVGGDLAGPDNDYTKSLKVVDTQKPVTDPKLKEQGKAVQATIYFQVQGKVTRQQVEDARRRIEKREAANQPVQPFEVLKWAKTEPTPK